MQHKSMQIYLNFSNILHTSETPTFIDRCDGYKEPL